MTCKCSLYIHVTFELSVTRLYVVCAGLMNSASVQFSSPTSPNFNYSRDFLSLHTPKYGMSHLSGNLALCIVGSAGCCAFALPHSALLLAAKRLH